jgi:GNAT superfamily N-acetyltransferase
VTTTSAPSTNELSIISAALEDPRTEPLLTGLTAEYTQRYGNFFGGTEQEMRRYPAAEFSAPTGGLLLVLEEGKTVAGGAFRRHHDGTAEFKRIWTHQDHRRRGLARVVLRALESEAAALGYRHVYLTTGPRQPEAVQLYLGTGYTPLFDLSADFETIGHLPFSKELPAPA